MVRFLILVSELVLFTCSSVIAKGEKVSAHLLQGYLSMCACMRACVGVSPRGRLKLYSI